MKKLSLYLFMTVLCSACLKDDDDVSRPKIIEEHGEVITDVVLNISSGTSVNQYKWRDPDGPGGNEPIIDKILLRKDTTYHVDLIFINTLEVPEDTISNSIIDEESEEHIIIYLTKSTQLDLRYMDKDVANLPLGFHVSIRPAQPGEDLLTILLKHQPHGKSTDPADGGTDLEVSFPLKIE